MHHKIKIAICNVPLCVLGMGYNEDQYSLPRWQDLSVSRQGMYDDLYHYIPTVGWMFLPLVQYHGGGDAATFEPLSDHIVEYEWGLAQYFGAGVAACYRGWRLYDSNRTRDVVLRWVSFFKKYRQILTSDVVHVRRADMQVLCLLMHWLKTVNTFASSLVYSSLQADSKVKYAAWPTSWRPPGADRPLSR